MTREPSKSEKKNKKNKNKKRNRNKNKTKRKTLDNAIQDFFIGLSIMVCVPIYHNIQIW